MRPSDRDALRLGVQDAHQRARVKGGAAAEDALAACHAACLAAGVAYVHKLPTPYRIVGTRGAQRTIVFAERTETDYAGVMLDGTRRRVAVECKSDADPAGAVYLRELRAHQRAALEAADARGDVAVLAVVLGRGPRRAVYALPWPVARARRALRASEIRDWRVAPGAPYLAAWAE